MYFWVILKKKLCSCAFMFGKLDTQYSQKTFQVHNSTQNRYLKTLTLSFFREKTIVDNLHLDNLQCLYYEERKTIIF